MPRSSPQARGQRAATSFETIDKPASAFFANLISLFDAPKETMDLDAVLQVVQDAWNYCPNRSLNGQRPAELFAQHVVDPAPHLLSI
jgi:hypothetical protein